MFYNYWILQDKLTRDVFHSGMKYLYGNIVSTTLGSCLEQLGYRLAGTARKTSQLHVNAIVKNKSSYPELFCKKFTGKQLRQGLSLRPATLLKKRLWHKCFAVNFVKFLKTPISVEHLRWLLLFCLTLCNSAKGEELH